MLKVHGLTAGYGESVILSDVHLTVDAGEVGCLIGRNGVGKTTFLRAVIGALPTRHGQIVVDGVDVTTKPAYARARAGIGYVPQGRGIFPRLTVHENLLMGLESGTGAPGNAADLMYARFPALADLRRRTAGVLSGGQQQQLAIARALIRQPRVLLLDEPTEGIQPSIVEDIARVIQDLRRQGEIAVLVVEQYVDFVLAVADSYHVMQRGTIVAHGPIAHLTDAVVHEHLTV